MKPARQTRERRTSLVPFLQLIAAGMIRRYKALIGHALPRPSGTGAIHADVPVGRGEIALEEPRAVARAEPRLHVWLSATRTNEVSPERRIAASATTFSVNVWLESAWPFDHDDVGMNAQSRRRTEALQEVTEPARLLTGARG